MKSQQDLAGILAAQNEIIAHWQSAGREGSLPGRGDINPGLLRAHLGSISILERDRDGATRLRLVGTRLREMFGADMRGLSLSEAGDTAVSMWETGLQAAFQSERPGYGIEDLGKTHHGWLRLPLAPLTDGGALVLCHDIILRKKSRERSFFPGHLPLMMQGATA